MPSEKTSALRELLRRPRIIRSLAIHDVFSALLAEQAGLEMLFIGGFGTSASQLGLPDLNYLSATEMADAIRRTTARLSIPIIADGDTGHGDLHNVQHTVRLFEKAGASGIILEDQVIPKRCGHFKDKQVVPTPEFLDRIRTALDTRIDSDFVVVARTDARQTHGLDEAVDRLNQACDLGADLAFLEAPQSVEELQVIPKQVPHPLMANMLSGGVTPILPIDDLEGLGYRIAVAPVETLMVCAGALRDLYQAWLKQGRVDDMAQKAMSFDELKKVLES